MMRNRSNKASTKTKVTRNTQSSSRAVATSRSSSLTNLAATRAISTTSTQSRVTRKVKVGSTSSVAFTSTATPRAATAVSRRRFGAAPADGEVLKTALYDVHVEAGGKMVPFCGYYLPVQYSDPLTASHQHCRTEASLFDVSHMGQVTIKGEHRVKAMEQLIVTDIAAMKPNLAKLTVFTNENGGIIDDCMISLRPDGDLAMVLNAGCKHKDMAHMTKQFEKFNQVNPSDDPVRFEYHDNRSLVALQGPKAAEVLGKLIPSVDLTQVAFMSSFEADINGIKAAVTRCGYTGEDGFEIGCVNDDAVKLWKTIVENPIVKPAGLGVRDSLRLEAGLSLYGNELSETVSPVEAGLGWVISPRRRREGGFLGADVILKQHQEGPKRKLVGLEILAGAPARHGATLHTQDGTEVGQVTSGGPAPSLSMKKIAIGMLNIDHTTVDTELQVNVRGKMNPVQVKKLPFVESRYYRIPKPTM